MRHRQRVAVSVAVTVALQLISTPRALPQVPPGSSWIEAGGYYHHVTSDFGAWKGGYARAVLSGARNVWYADARVQEAFKDRGAYGSLANVHTFSSRFYTQLAVGGGTGDFVLPELRLDGSLHLK